MLFIQPILVFTTLYTSIYAYPLVKRAPQDIPATTAAGIQHCNGTAVNGAGVPLATATSFAGAAAIKYALRDDTGDDDGCDDGGDGSSSVFASATPSDATPPDATATEVSASAVTSVDATATEVASGTLTASAPAATSTDTSGGDDGCDDGGDDSSSVVAVSTATDVTGASATTDIGASSVALSSIATAAPTATATDATGAGAGDSATQTASAATSTSTASGTSTQQQNAEAAQKLNAQFESMTASDSCTEGSQACVPDNGASAFAQCVSGKWVLTPCSSSNQCFALPLVNSAGTTLACTSTSDAQSRFANAGATGGVDGKSN